MKIAVVGGGVVGMSTALQLKNKFGNSEIVVIAENYDDIVSYVAAGLFRVGNDYSGPTEEITKSWVKDSFEYYNEIRKCQESAEAGIADVSCYMFSNIAPVKNDWMESVLPKSRDVTPDEFNLVNGNWKYGSYLETMVISCSYHLPWAQKKLQENKVQLMKKKLTSLNELVDDYDVIFNCSGLGAKALSQDRRMIPIRGQVAKVNAPWIKTCFLAESDTYIIPGVDGNCTIGGTRDFNSLRKEACEHIHRSIRERCEDLLPSLKKAPTFKHLVGFRPYREGGVRVEIEKMSTGRGSAVIVHNYGHSGYGVSTAPGTSKYAIMLAEDFHKSSMSNV